MMRPSLGVPVPHLASPSRSPLFTALAALVALAPSVPGARAADFLVLDPLDAVDAVPGDGACAAPGGGCTLRAAVMEANALAGADRIFLPEGTWHLDLVASADDGELDAAADLDLLDDVSIVGVRADVTVVTPRGSLATEQPNGSGDRAFEVHPGVSATIGALTVRGGSLFGIGGCPCGSGIANAGTLVLSDAAVLDNGGLSDGGGIYNAVGSVLVLRRSTVARNWGDDFGGVYNRGSALLENATVSGNTGYIGGGVWSTGALTVRSSTITDNQASFVGGLGATSGTISSSIVANNGDDTLWLGDPPTADCSGPLVSQGHNVMGYRCPQAAFVALASDQLGSLGAPIDARLAPLGPHGGSAPTHLPLPGSPALDGGHPAAPGTAPPACPATDQRFVARALDADGDTVAHCDAGALEVTACENGLDDDGDGRIDTDGGAAANGGIPLAAADPQCRTNPLRISEASDSACGLGGEAALAALGLALRGRSARRRR